MSKRPAPSPFTPNYYAGKTQDHAQYLAILQLQNELFRDLGEAAVKLFRRRYLEDDETTREPLSNHAWFGRHSHAEDAGLPQMEKLLDAIFDENPDLYEDMVDLQFQMSAPKDKANWMSGRLKDPLELSNTDYWMKVDGATNAQLPTLNNLKRLSIFCGTKIHRRDWLNGLVSHGIRLAKGLHIDNSPVDGHCSLLPGQNYMVSQPFDLSEMQEAFPCSTANIHLDDRGSIALGTLQAPCSFLGTIPGLYPQGETLEDCMWGVFYHGNSGLFVAPTHTNDLPALESFNLKEGDYVDKHLTGVMNILSTTEGWHNLLAPTLSMSINISDADSWLTNNSDADCTQQTYWPGLTRALGAAIFFRMASDKPLLSPAFFKKSKDSDEEYIHPVLTHTGSMWLPGDPMAEVSDEADRKVRFINSWADKRDTLTLKQGDGRYYHNIVRCSVCNGRVKVMLGRTPTPISPLQCPHCARPGIEIDLIHWTVKT